MLNVPPLDGLRATVRHARRLPDRLLHFRRREEARSRLQRVLPGVDTVEFVCHGNICRSPFAERRFRQLLGAEPRDDIALGSSGFYEQTGRESPPEAVSAAGDFGVDLSDHRSRMIDPARLLEPDPARTLVLVMEPGQRDRLRHLTARPDLPVVVLGDLDPGRIDTRRIRDPWGHDPEMFEDVFQRIDRCLGALRDLLPNPAERTRGARPPA